MDPTTLDLMESAGAVPVLVPFLSHAEPVRPDLVQGTRQCYSRAHSQGVNNQALVSVYCTQPLACSLAKFALTR